MSGDIQPPRSVPKSWAVGINSRPKEEQEKDDEGPYEVRMTFSETEAPKAWFKWLMDIDPAWGGKP